MVVKSKKGLQTLDKGSHNLKDVSWIVHDSVAYVFPDPVSVNVSNATATGNWRQISHQASSSDVPVQKDLFTLWFDHGQKPRSANYSYIVAPAMTTSSAEQYSKKTGIVILANTPEMQAVQNTNLHVCEVVFYQPGTIKLPGNINLTAKSACIVMVRMAGNAIAKIAVSDPTEKLKTLRFEISTPINLSGDNVRSSWNKDSKSSNIDVDLPVEGYAGKSVVMEVGKK